MDSDEEDEDPAEVEAAWADEIRQRIAEIRDGSDLAHELFESVDGAELGGDDLEEVEAAWAEEIKQRVDDLDSGRVAAIPSEEVFAKARAISRAAAQARARAG